MFRQLLLLFLLSVVQYSNVNSQSTISIGNTVLLVDTIITGLDVPWELAIGGDGNVWMTERKGLVSRVGINSSNKTVLLDLTASVYQAGESGLLGMAFHPNFNVSPEVFIAYTYRENGSTFERLVKYRYVDDTLTDPDTLIEGIPGNNTHDGCRLLFMTDGTLLMTTGDAQNQNTPQNLNSLNGKVLRLNTDGSIPTDNPYSNSYVYSFGHRNAQGLCIGPAGKFYLSEHGPNTDDEFMVLEKGRNYGWPNVHGYCNLPAEITFCNANNVMEPMVTWTPTIAPSDMVYYQNAAFPEWNGCILMTVLKDKKIIALRMNSNGDSVLSQTHYLTNMFGRLRDIAVNQFGDIFIATNGASWNNSDPNTHSIIRLRFQNTSSIKTINSNSVSVYPNPSNGLLFIQSNLDIDTIIVYDYLHKSVYSSSGIDFNNKAIDISFLSAGVYYIKVQVGESIIYKKIIIN